MPTDPLPADELSLRLRREVANGLESAGIRGTQVVVAVSGGADSVALLALLLELRSEHSLQLTVAHLDHALRPESADDAAWLAELCAAWDVPLIVERVSDEVARTLRSEAAARGVRRDFLARSCQAVGAAWTALAHMADDQVETVLHRLLRGTGPRGLRGMSSVAPLAEGVSIIRPLLDVSRRSLREWLQSRGLTWRTDASNSDLRFTRNRLRHTLLPLLREQFNPQVDAAILRVAQECRERDDWLHEVATQALQAAMLERQPQIVRLSVAALSPVPELVRREACIQLWDQQHWPRQRMTTAHWSGLAELLSGTTSAARRQFPASIDAVLDVGILRLEYRGSTAIARSESHETA